MKFLESRLLGVETFWSKRRAVLSFANAADDRFELKLNGVERLLVNEMREQNIVDEITLWNDKNLTHKAREAAFYLTTGIHENQCDSSQKRVALEAYARVENGDFQLLEISAIYGAQILAMVESIETVTENTLKTLSDDILGNS